MTLELASFCKHCGIIEGSFFFANKRIDHREHKSRVKILFGTSVVVQWLRLHAFTTGGVDSTLGWGTKIPHAQKSFFLRREKKRVLLKFSSKGMGKEKDNWIRA